jgi:hypothetical protein
MTETKQVDPINNPELTPYQRALFLEINNKPDLMHLFKVIFGDYPQVVLAEQKFTAAATKRRKQKGMELTLLRLKMEAYIEERLAKLAGIDVDGLKKQFEDVFKNATDKLAEEIKQEEDKKALEAVVNQSTSL